MPGGAACLDGMREAACVPPVVLDAGFKGSGGGIGATLCPPEPGRCGIGGPLWRSTDVERVLRDCGTRIV
jgi:hypothetical protein